MTKNEAGTWQRYCWSSHVRIQREYGISLLVDEAMNK